MLEKVSICSGLPTMGCDLFLAEQSHSGKLSGLLALLKVGRRRLMIPCLDAIIDNPSCVVNVPSALLKSATFHSSEDVRVSVLELACIHPK